MLRLTDTSKLVAPSGRAMVFGALNPDDIAQVATPRYQREILPVTSVATWTKAFAAGEVPALDLGTAATRMAKRGAYTVINGEVNVIDGLQRLTTARIVRDGGGQLLIPVMVYLGTTYDWEVDRFRTLNADRRKVSSNVLLSNVHERNAAVGELYRLSVTARNSLLLGKVQWTQNPHRGNLLTATMLVRVAAELHAHFGKNLRESHVAPLSADLGDMVDDITPRVFAANMSTFFMLIEAACNFSSLETTKGVYQLRLAYLLSLARTFGTHSDFWRGHLLDIPESMFEGLAGFTLDKIQQHDISSMGRAISGLVEKMTKKAAGSARRSRLTPW